jgi:hypothetical protein
MIPKGQGAHKVDVYPEFARYCDGLEIHNGEAVFPIPGKIPSKANEKAEVLYFNKRLWEFCQHPIEAISTSDGHSLYELGRSGTQIEMPNYFEMKNAD